MLFSIKYNDGFTLIETLVGILITILIFSALMLGLTQTKMYLSSVRVKEKAYEELKNWTNEWKTMIAAGVSTFPEDDLGGTRVALQKDINGNTVTTGRMYKTIQRAQASGTFSIYYNLETFIVWEKRNFFFFNPEGLDTIRFNAYQIRFNL